MTALVRAGTTAVLICTALLLPAAAAAAQEPDQTGWWNRVSAGGMVLPQPTAQEGDLRITAGPDAPTAYSAVLYTALGSTSATLDLQLRDDRRVGTPAVVACPTISTDWPAGDNQPYDSAPPYDCAIGAAEGTVSEDGTMLSFALDAATQIEDGIWSLALVPAAGSSPFSVDVAAPGPEAFEAAPPDDPSADSPGFDGSFDSGSGSTDSSGGGFAEPSFDSGFETPPSLEGGTAEVPPLVAGGDEAALPEAAAPAPAVAGTRPPPVLLARPAGVVEDLGAGRRLLALLVLAGGSAAVGYAAGQQRPGPRLLGGRARLGTPALAAATATGPAQDRPRGIGRFAKVRDAAPRRLR